MDAFSPTESQAEARSAAEKALDRAHAQLTNMRASLSMLTANSAQLALALEKRNQEYDVLVARQSEFMGRIDALKTELNLATAERANFKEQVNERNAQLVDLHGQFTALSTEAEAVATSKAALEAQLTEVQADLASRVTEIAELNARQADLQTQLGSAVAVKADAEARLAASTAELDGLQGQLTALQDELAAVWPAEIGAPAVEGAGFEAPETRAAEIATAPAEAAPAEDVGSAEARPGAKIGALSAAVTALVERGKEQEAALDAATAQVAALDAQANTLAAEKAGLEASLQEKEQALTDLNAQIEGLNSKLADLQTQLDDSLAAGQEAAEKLQADAAELDALETQLTAWQSDLRTALPAEAAPVEAPVEEGAPETVAAEAAPETPVARRTAKAGALAASVAAVLASLKQKDAGLAALDEQVNAITAEKAALEGTLQEKEEAISGLNDRIERLTGSLNFVQAQLDGTLLGKGEVETRLRASEAELDDLGSRLAALQDEIGAVVPAAAASDEAAPGEAAPDEAAPEATETPRIAKAGALAASVAALVSAGQQKDTALQDAAAQIASLNEQVAAFTAEKTGLAASLQEKEQELADLKAQFEELHGKVAGLSTRVAAVAPFQEAASFSAALADLPATKRGAATAAITAGVQPQLTNQLQGLSGIKGIGRALRGRLYDAGVGTYWEVATLSDEDLRQVLALSPARFERINLEEVRADAYNLARETDSVGHIWRGRAVDDFEVFNGIGAVFEERLYQAGICTYEQLAGATVEQLTEICRAPEMNMPDYADWLEQARKAVEERQAQAQAAGSAAEGEPQAAQS